MAGDRTTPVVSGKQTPEQAAITATDQDGRSDAERQSAWRGAKPGRAPQASGGASQGHADQKATGDPGGVKSAEGHYEVEKE